MGFCSRPQHQERSDGKLMPRSVKKGPYVDPKLLKKVEAINRTGEKKVIRLGRVCLW